MLDVLKDILFQILQLALEALLPVLVAFIIRWVKGQIDIAKGKLNEQQQTILDAAVRIAVLAAEQLNLSGFVENKKAEAIKIAQAYLIAHGIDIDVQVLADMIEAAVMDEFNRPDLLEVSQQ